MTYIEAKQQSGSTYATYRKAWTAYVTPGVFFHFVLVIASTVSGIYIGWIAASIIFAILLGTFVYRVASIRVIKLYADDAGVWVFRGILPWAKGAVCVRWRDLEDASYSTGFFSWLFKSYTVRIGSRYTKTTEIILPHIARGDEAVNFINAVHHQIISRTVAD